MKLFPFILARISGLPFNHLEKLSFQSIDKLEIILQKQSLLEKHKNELLELLGNSKEEIDCGYVLKNLAYLKTKLLHDKKAKLSSKLEANLHEHEKPFLGKIEKKLERYEQTKKELKDLATNFEIFYLDEIFRSRSILQEISKEPLILNGLLLSSHVFFNQLQKYNLKNIAAFAKKEFQTERTLLRYLSRICSKTSPFSTFTSLSVFSLDEDLIEGESKNIIRLNNRLFDLWRDALNNYPAFFLKLKMGLNPSLKKVGEEWIYLLNSRNVESVQKLENNEIIEYIFESLVESNREMVFEEFVHKILLAVDSELEAIEKYLLDLVDYGFLEWRWPFSGLDPFWYKKLKKLLASFPEDRFLLQISTDLDKILENIELYEVSGFEQRLKLQIDTFEIVKRISSELLNKTQLIEKEEIIDISRNKHFRHNKFQITPERLFYEDVKIPFKPKWKITEINKVISELNNLLDALSPLHFNVSQSKMKHFFLENYQKGNVINLLLFYENYFKNVSKSALDESKSAIDQRLSWQRELMENIKLTKNGELNIPLDLLKKLSKKSKSIKFENPPSRGTFIQFFKEENQFKGFAETSFEGYGKMIGRFLHLFSPSVTDAFQNWNEKLRKDMLWVENTDASIYNPNLHPPLMPFEIRMPGSQNTLPTEQQISVDKLSVVYNELENKLDLIHQPTDRKVFVFDLGFEALESRSPLFQLLASFSYPLTSQSILAEIVNHHFEQKEDPIITFQPRICVGNHLVIQRRRWYVKKDFLPFKLNSEKESYYFVRINKWVRENQIPSKVFITIKPGDLKKGDSEKTDDYKPQFIDFESPVFVQLFHKLIKKITVKLKIEEVLPFPNEAINDQYYASEYLVQWETTSH